MEAITYNGNSDVAGFVTASAIRLLLNVRICGRSLLSGLESSRENWPRAVSSKAALGRREIKPSTALLIS